MTSAGKLPAKHIIHVIVPVWQGGSRNEHIFLGVCHKNALSLCEKEKIRSVAIPPLGVSMMSGF